MRVERGGVVMLCPDDPLHAYLMLKGWTLETIIKFVPDFAPPEEADEELQRDIDEYLHRELRRRCV